MTSVVGGLLGLEEEVSTVWGRYPGRLLGSVDYDDNALVQEVGLYDDPLVVAVRLKQVRITTARSDFKNGL